MSLEAKSADADERLAANAASGEAEGDGEASSAIAAGIRRDVRPWLNLVDDLSNLTRDAEISVPQVIDTRAARSRVVALVESLLFDAQQQSNP